MSQASVFYFTFLLYIIISIITQLNKNEDSMQAANLRGFRASVNPRFEAGIPDFMNGILNFSIHFNAVHRKVDWWNPKMKSLNSMPGMLARYGVKPPFTHST